MLMKIVSGNPNGIALTIPKGSQQLAGGRSEAKTTGHDAHHKQLFDPGRDRSSSEPAATPAGVENNSLSTNGCDPSGIVSAN